MELSSDFSLLGIVLQVALIDLLLGGDNAVVIALACRSLPPHLLRKAMLVGTSAAVLMRIFLTTLVGVLLLLPGLKLAGSVALLVIAVKLVIKEEDPEEDDIGRDATDFMDAVILILLADLVMSLDNVVALSAVAQGNIGILIFGLLLSVPLVVFGSRVVGLLLEKFPELILGGGALLGWVAGEIATTDPLIADWINAQSPGLGLIVPVLCTAFVLIQARIIEAERNKRGAIARPRRRRRRAIEVPPKAGKTAGESIQPAAVPDQPVKWGALFASIFSFCKGEDPEPVTVRHHRPPSAAEAEAEAALILVVEDNASDRAEVLRALDWLGYAAEGAEDGEEAWTLLQAKRHGLVITDCYMPRLDGFSLSLRLRGAEDGTLSTLPVVAMVAHYNPADGIGYRQSQAGMNDCVGKPPSLDQLERAVGAWLPAAARLRRPILGENA